MYHDLDRAQVPAQIPEFQDRLRDLRTGAIYTPASLFTLSLAPGSGTLLEELSR